MQKIFRVSSCWDRGSTHIVTLNDENEAIRLANFITLNCGEDGLVQAEEVYSLEEFLISRESAMYDELLTNSDRKKVQRARALAKLTPEDRKILGL